MNKLAACLLAFQLLSFSAFADVKEFEFSEFTRTYHPVAIGQPSPPGISEIKLQIDMDELANDNSRDKDLKKVELLFENRKSISVRNFRYSNGMYWSVIPNYWIFSNAILTVKDAHQFSSTFEVSLSVLEGESFDLDGVHDFYNLMSRTGTLGSVSNNPVIDRMVTSINGKRTVLTLLKYGSWSSESALIRLPTDKYELAVEVRQQGAEDRVIKLDITEHAAHNGKFVEAISLLTTETSVELDQDGNTISTSNTFKVSYRSHPAYDIQSVEFDLTSN